MKLVSIGPLLRPKKGAGRSRDDETEPNDRDEIVRDLLRASKRGDHSGVRAALDDYLDTRD